MTSTTPPVSADFISGPIADLGVSVTRTPVTTTLDNITGQKTYTDGAPESITVIWNNPNKEYTVTIEGQVKSADGVMFVKSTQTINKQDKILFDSETYRVFSVDRRNMDTILGYLKVILFLI